jgi:dihydrofolate synthase/folylpolyglutamate synthase
MDPVEALLARDQHGVKFGLESIRTLCAALGHPERSCPSVLVAGTNGKGSVTAMTATALTAAGHRTARYTSPHLVRVEERFVIDDQPVSRDALGDAAATVLDVERRCLDQGRLHAPVTFFEITTATAFELFRRAAAQVLVLEVGMGGRLDATNASDPCVCAITSIALDHMRFLGDTLGAIAFEKAGIMRAGRPTVLGPLPGEARDVIAQVAAERRVPLIAADEGVHWRRDLLPDGRTTLTLSTPEADYGTVTLALRGAHQVANAIVAVRLLEQARLGGLRLSREAIITGLVQARWPARLQEVVLRDGKRILLDAAHNPAGAATLAHYLREVRAPRAAVVFGAMRDKAIVEMLHALEPCAARFVFTQATSPRAMPATDVASEARQAGVSVPLTVVPDHCDALQQALDTADLVVVAGSMFVIGELLPHLPAVV